MHVLLNFCHGGEVLAAGVPAGGLASACPAADLPGALMDKQLDKLLIFFPVSER